MLTVGTHPQTPKALKALQRLKSVCGDRTNHPYKVKPCGAAAAVPE